jgi:hypothetical protein
MVELPLVSARATASAGVGLYTETNTTVGNTKYVGYAVTAVATNGVGSSQALANRLMADCVTNDSDGDGIPDSRASRMIRTPSLRQLLVVRGREGKCAIRTGHLASTPGRSLAQLPLPGHAAFNGIVNKLLASSGCCTGELW